MEAHSANILRKSGRGASREGGGYVRAGAGQVEGWVPVRPARMASRWWGAASFPGTGCGGVSGAGRGSGCAASPGGAAVGWRTEGSGRCVVGAGRVLECRASGVVPRTGGAGSSGSRAGVGSVRAGADRWARRGPAWTLCSGEAGMEPLPFPNGAGRIPVRSPCSGVEPLFRRARHRVGADRWERRGSAWTLCSGGAGRISVRVAVVSGRAGRIPRTQGLPSSRAAPSGRGPMLRFRTLFVLFCSVPPRRNRRRLQIRGFAAREKRKSCFFIFTL